MNIDRNLLRQLSTETTIQQKGIASLPRGIHRLSDLRDWVTFETIALAPIPVQRLGEWGIISLLTVPKNSKDKTEGYGTPWAVVEWSLATMQVVKKVDLRPIKANNPLWQPQVISTQPADTSVNLTPQIRTLRENTLFSTLDNFCSSINKSKEDFLDLAKYYSGLLPQEFYLYYHDLVPESKEWLLPNIPAISLEVVNSKEENISLDKLNFQVPETPIKVPIDLTERLDNWFKQCTDITNSVSSENQELGKRMSLLLTAIEKRRILPGFRLAFVGEFSRGKSYLINRLLDRNILPEGVLPTTATLTSIVAGSEEQMEVRLGGKVDIRPLEETSWEELLATDQAGSDKEVFAGVRISLNHEWLRSLDTEIIDTPGAGDLSDRRANMVLDLLNQCDAAVLVVSATSPFSMTEAAFLEQEVIGRHVPRIIVAVSKLDMIPPDERAKVMQNICNRITNVASNIPVLSTYPIEESQQEADTLASIITEIESLVDRGERRVWRSRQVRKQLSDWLNQMAEITQGAISTMRMNAEEIKCSLRQAENEIEKADITWDNLHLELDKRRLRRAKEIRQQVAANQKELIENLEFEIQRTPDLKLWWERDLPFRLRRELTILSRKFESFLLKLLSQDIEWLQNEMSKLFNTTIKQQVFTPQQSTEIQFELENRDITDVQKYRLFTRIGSTAAMIAGSVLGGPIGIAASTGVLIFSEQYLNKELDTQREVLSDELKHIVDASTDEYCQQVSERLRRLYQIIIDDIESEQAAWKFAKKAAFNMNQANSDNEKNWQQILKLALDLQQEIASAL
ncbi:dynamin family protein [Nostoc sp. TCL26-01]|uniref:dynamin family protein n=1 Tax=Nostoc sp. TCL26-01 TaxID=2576904 RepID=UPI0015B8DD6E|nr:dynamin family protein [Nostoc sp. TCL26-01]QLE59051.1 GTPase [Nostoc sp. TCL26-01]